MANGNSEEAASTSAKTERRTSSGDESDAGWRPPNTDAYNWVQRQINSGASAEEFLKLLMPNIPASATLNMDEQEMWRAIMQLMTDPPRRTKLDQHNTLDDAVELIRNAKKIMVLTGAGVSVSCGIPDFRSKNGVYARLHLDYPDLPNPQAMFDIDFFRKNQRPFFDFAKEIYPGQFAPSKSHKFIAALDNQGQLLRNYTQNIDTLEQVAGIDSLVQCHGSFARATCCACGHSCDSEAIREDIFAQRIPRCPKCPSDTERNVMKPDIVFFGESLPSTFHDRMTEDKDVTDLLIVMGSSMRVRPVALIPDSIPANVPQIVINNELLGRLNADIYLLGDCDYICHELCLRLGGPFLDLCVGGRTGKLKGTKEEDIVYDDEGREEEEEVPTKRPRLDEGETAGKNADEGETGKNAAPPRRIIDYAQTDEYVLLAPNRNIFFGANCYKSNGNDDDSSSSESDDDDESYEEEEEMSRSLPDLGDRPDDEEEEESNRCASV